MQQPVPIEIIMIIIGCVVAFTIYILFCFCSRNRVDDDIPVRSTYIGPIGWFQRYQARKEDAESTVNRL